MTAMPDTVDSVSRAEPTDRDNMSNEHNHCDDSKTTPQKQ